MDKINYFVCDMRNDDGQKYGLAYFYFPEILAVGEHDIEDGFDPSLGSDLESTDIWNQVWITRYESIEEALIAYNEFNNL